MGTPSTTAIANVQALWLDGFDMTRLGLLVTDGLTDHRAGPQVSVPSAAIPGRVGAVLLSNYQTIGPRAFDVSAVQQSTTLAQLEANTDDLKRRAYDGLVEVRLADSTARHYNARCMRLEVAPRAPVLWDGGIVRQDVRLRFVADDPLAYDNTDQSVGLSTATAELPTGTGDSLPSVVVNGPTTQGFTLTVKDQAAATIFTLTLSSTVTLSSTEFVTVNSAAGTVVGTTGDNLIATLSTGSQFPVVRAQDGAGSTSPWPTIEVDTTGVTGTVTYARAWL